MAVRSRVAPSLLLVFLLVGAGCVGVLTGSEPLVLEAEPVAVSADAQSDSGYEEARRTTEEMSREFSAAGQTREVRVTNYLAEYSRTVSVEPIGSGEIARFVVVSTPAVELFGRTFNPVGQMSNRQLVETLQSEYSGLENLQSTGERTASVLGSEANVSTFTGDAELSGSDVTVELTIHVTKVRHEGDFVVAVAVHPSVLDGEVDRVDALLAGIEHPAS